MGIGLKQVSMGLTIAALSALGTSAVNAQEVIVAPQQPVRIVNPRTPASVTIVRPVTTTIYSTPVPLQTGTIPYEFLKEFYSYDGNFFQNRGLLRQAAVIIGPFPENEIYRDGREVDQLYQQVLARQFATGPILRTNDLPSPFTETIGTLPQPEAITPPLPVQPPVFEAPLPVAPPTVIPPSQSEGPVPALWYLK